MIRRGFNGLRRLGASTCVLIVLASGPVPAWAGCSIVIDESEAAALADKIWRNESGRDVDKILWWNAGENFASLGIGHFIWYPAGVNGPFKESFPELLAYLWARGVAMPEWLAPESAPNAPWTTREDFMQRRNGAEATELRRLLVDTVPIQAEFMLARMEQSLPTIIAETSFDDAVVIEARFCALVATPLGRYALVDYVNFKGEGTKPEEKYEDHGWGLKQVLMEMLGESPANEDFAAAAERVLERRVRNAPPARHEERWLPGWLHRVDGYR